MTLFTVLPHELRSELLFYLTPNDLYIFNNGEGLHSLPEFAIIDNEKFWHAIWRTFYSKCELSDTYPGSETSWKETLKVILAVQREPINENNCSSFHVYFEYGCELHFKSLKICHETIRLLGKSMNPLMVKMLLEQYDQLSYSHCSVGNHYQHKSYLISQILVQATFMGRHGKERIEVVKEIIKMAPSFMVSLDDCGKNLIEDTIGRNGSAEDLIYFEKLMTLNYNRLLKNAILARNKEMTNILSQNRINDLNYTYLLNEYLLFSDDLIDLDVVKFFTENGADCRTSNYHLLRTALRHNKIDMAKYLLEKFPLI